MAQKPPVYGTLPSRPSFPARRFPTAIDKIRLFSPFKVADRFDGFRLFGQYEIHSDQKRRDRVLFQHRGEDIRGVFALWSDETLRVRIGSRFDASPQVFCWLTFNPSMFLHGVNTRPLTKREFCDVLDQVQHRLEECGLLFNIYQAGLSQLDLCRDIALPRSLDAYWPLLHRMDTANNTLGRNFPTGMWRGNKSTRWCFYDKVKEVRAKARKRGQDAAMALAFLPGPHTLRLERRLRNAAAVKREAKVATLGQLLYSHDSLSELLDDRLLKGVFREPEPECSALNVSALPRRNPSKKQLWQVMLAAAAVQELHLKNLLAIQGYDHLIDSRDWVEAEGLLANELGAPHQASTLSKMRTKLRGWRLTYGLSRQGVPYAQLYAELYRATFALQTDDVEEQDRLIAALLPFKPLPIIRGSNRWPGSKIETDSD